VFLAGSQSTAPTNYRLAEIARAVGELPLALATLAVRLAEPLSTPAGVLDAIQQAPSPAGFDAFQTAANTEIRSPKGLFNTLKQSLGRLGSETRRGLSAFGYVADSPVPIELAVALTGSEHELRALVRDSARESILDVYERTPAFPAGSIRIHTLTTATIAATNEPAVVQQVWSGYNRRLNAINSDDPAAMRRESVHFEAWYRHVERVLGAEHPDTLMFRNNLAIGYKELGRTAEAVKLDEETLKIKERVLGAGHPDTLSARSNLAIGYLAFGRTADAVKLWEETLKIMERVLGAEHPDTLSTRGNLAGGYRALGRTADADALGDTGVPSQR